MDHENRGTFASATVTYGAPSSLVLLVVAMVLGVLALASMFMWTSTEAARSKSEHAMERDIDKATKELDRLTVTLRDEVKKLADKNEVLEARIYVLEQTQK